MFAQKNLFNTHIPPLAERMRPQKLEDFVGQEHLLGKTKFFRQAIENDSFGSCIFWGPPGTGKTSLAKVIAHTTQRTFVAFNAVFQGVKDLRQIIQDAKKSIDFGGKGTVLFVDEIHRFNKAQQDSFLNPIEKGIIILIGATTENPSFEINSAVLSRCNVYALKPLEDEHVEKIIKNTLSIFEKQNVQLDLDAQKLLINYANGDARVALNALEFAIQTVQKNSDETKILTQEIIKNALTSRKIAYDKNGEEHYNLISALHKSLRGSDVQAALYWLARMIQGGADPLYIVRRLVRFASEDIGLADPTALQQAIAAQQAVHFLGYPECDAVLAQCVIYLATAPKSNNAYVAMNNAKQAVEQTRNEPVPLNIRNAPTKLMKNLGYGKDYEALTGLKSGVSREIAPKPLAKADKYDHNEKNNFSGQSFLPKSLEKSEFYIPGEYGFEKEIKKRIDYWKNLKNKN